jgi:hypothetical protein
VSDEHEERFHQEIYTVKQQYQGKCGLSGLADIFWTLRGEVPQEKYKRTSSNVTF